MRAESVGSRLVRVADLGNRVLDSALAQSVIGYRTVGQVTAGEPMTQTRVGQFPDELERVASYRLYEVPGVEEVRRDLRAPGLVLVVQANNLDEQAVEEIVKIEWGLRRTYRVHDITIDVWDRFDRPVLPSAHPEELAIVPRHTYATGTHPAS
jgi:hypothetical protein